MNYSLLYIILIPWHTRTSRSCASWTHKHFTVYCPYVVKTALFAAVSKNQKSRRLRKRCSLFCEVKILIGKTFRCNAFCRSNYPKVFPRKGLQLYLKRDSDTGVYCEFCEICKNTFFTEHLWVTITASGDITSAEY